ncbi:MAG: acyltransferase [Weeksellaceae bacterium]|nr:acyltransferase [Weeksellaceae bacterium]
MRYRNDIDGLRAIAVTSVIIYHLGYLKNGYLGVDIFFVISGYLITTIMHKETLNGQFSLASFYERRIRRIIPLLLVCTMLTIPMGIVSLLPQDLYGLARSVIASNISLNNILMYFTSGGYWETTNEFKPLMHTWSLGIEEQFYIFYPLVFLVLQQFKIKYIGPAIVVIALISIGLFAIQDNPTAKFFLLQFRFFELAAGGIAAVYFHGDITLKKHSPYMVGVSILLLLGCLFNLFPISNGIYIMVSVVCSIMLLVYGGICSDQYRWFRLVFENSMMLFIGKISFSLYMWHQIIFAFGRMTLFREINFRWALLLSILTFGLSILTYYFVENFFRNRRKITYRKTLIISFCMFFVSTGASVYIMLRSGVVKNFPELNMYFNVESQKQFSLTGSSNVLLHYNNRIFDLTGSFKTHKKRILVIGDSFGRDAANILLESSMKDKIEVRYIDIEKLYTSKSSKNLLATADLFVFSFDTFNDGKTILKQIENGLNFIISESNVAVIGTKNFGSNFHSGYDWISSRNLAQPSQYYTEINPGVIKTNHLMKAEWGSSYIDIISPLQKEGTNKIRLYTPNNKMISFDTGHLTQEGAKFIAKLLSPQITSYVLRN